MLVRHLFCTKQHKLVGIIYQITLKVSYRRYNIYKELFWKSLLGKFLKILMKIFNHHGRYHLHDPIISSAGFRKIILESVSMNISNHGVSRTLSDLYEGASLCK